MKSGCSSIWKSAAFGNWNSSEALRGLIGKPLALGARKCPFESGRGESEKAQILSVRQDIDMRVNKDKSELEKIVSKSDSWSQFARNLGIKSYNGTIGRFVKNLACEHGLNTEHFDGGKERQRKQNTKYPLVEKSCKVCFATFKTRVGSPKEQHTCSYACSNTYFRSGENNGQWKAGNKHYARICFMYHERRCIICGEERIVAVHHYDENRKNNAPENLIPICPTHHVYFHSRYRNLVEVKIDEYRAEWIKKNRT